MFLGKLTFLGRMISLVISLTKLIQSIFCTGQSSWPVLTNGKCLWLSLLLCNSCMCMHNGSKRCTENLSIINISRSYLNQYCKNIQEHHQRDKSVFFCSPDSCNQQDKPCTLLIELLHMLLQKQIEPVKSNLHWLRPSYDLKLIKYDYQLHQNNTMG